MPLALCVHVHKQPAHIVAKGHVSHLPLASNASSICMAVNGQLSLNVDNYNLLIHYFDLIVTTIEKNCVFT